MLHTFAASLNSCDTNITDLSFSAVLVQRKKINTTNKHTQKKKKNRQKCISLHIFNIYYLNIFAFALTVAEFPLQTQMNAVKSEI